jgi:hypothetical protein
VGLKLGLAVVVVAFFGTLATSATSATARPTASVVLFKNGAAFCVAFGWTTKDGFVACSARIKGTWRSALLLRSGKVVRGRQAARSAQDYQPLRKRWRGGPFLCTVATGGVICVTTSGHGFGINGRAITVR